MTETNILDSTILWKAFEVSHSIGPSRGMIKLDFSSQAGSLSTFSKTHSYGEYIFDWKWAEAFERSGLDYYPKLTSMVPFTPATATHFHGPESTWQNLLSQHDNLLSQHSSAHFLFTKPNEQKFLAENGYSLRDSFQYHFINEQFQNFEDFLNRIKTKKAKNIRNERIFPELQIERLTGSALLASHAHEMYSFYLTTIDSKNAIPYLTKEFFEIIFKELAHNILYVRANHGDQPLAGALFYYDQHKLYGRYWGSKQEIKNLHFELCYYQGIEFCIEKKISVFEAGAQGEHKIARGFRPVLTSSAHKIVHPGFSKAISEFLKTESLQIQNIVQELTKLLPFKQNQFLS